MKFGYNGGLYDSCESHIFNIKIIDDSIMVEWKPEVLKIVQLPRYFGWFSSIDSVRLNAQTTINCKFKDGMDIEKVGNILMESLNADMMINAVVRQCFMELGL